METNTNTNMKAVSMAQVLAGHQMSAAKIDAMAQQAADKAAAGISKVTDAMSQEPTRTRYVKTISVSSMADATVSTLLDDTALAALTAAGTDEAGNNQYDFLVNGVKTGTYTKTAKLLDILAGINSSQTAGVTAEYSHSAETDTITFTARKYGKNERIELGEGLADALFGPPAGSDRSGESFATVYGFTWLQAGKTTTIYVGVGAVESEFEITTETTVQEIVDRLERSSGNLTTHCYNKYTGRIEAKRNSDGTLLDVTVKDKRGTPYTPNTNPTDYTPGQDAVFTEIRVNGDPVPIVGKKMSIRIPTRVSELTNNSNFQSKAEVDAAINAKLGSTYKAGGSVAFAALPAPDEAHLGFVYNVTDKFTTTADFVEGAGKKNAAGTNVAIVAVTDGETTSYKYDVLGGFVDLSGLETTEQIDEKLAGKVDSEVGKGLSTNDFTNEDKAKLDSIAFASDEEWAAALAEIYGTSEA